MNRTIPQKTVVKASKRAKSGARRDRKQQEREARRQALDHQPAQRGGSGLYSGPRS